MRQLNRELNEESKKEREVSPLFRIVDDSRDEAGHRAANDMSRRLASSMDEVAVPLDAEPADDAYSQSPRLGKSNFFRASSITSNDEAAP